MKKKRIFLAVLGIAATFSLGSTARADYETETTNQKTTKKAITITDGVSIGPVDISGMTLKEAQKAVKTYVADYAGRKITIDVNGEKAYTTASQLGYRWQNTSVAKDAQKLCRTGNVIKRYKDKTDIAKEKKKYDLDMGLQEEKLTAKIEELCKPYEQEAENPKIELTSSGFQAGEGKDGLSVDVDKTAEAVKNIINKDWDGSGFQIQAATEVEKPKYTGEECKKMSTTPMGSYTTQFSTYAASYNRNKNIENGARLINNITLYPGESYSLLEHLSPWTEDNGWYEAGTFENGKESKGLGGGICQVSTTLYNALLDAELEIVTRFNHSMTVTYVPLSADAAIAEGSKDLVFRNNTDAPIYIRSSYNAGGSITYNVYGHDTRPKNRTIQYVSETIETIPSNTTVTKDATKPIGYRQTESVGYTGYVAKLWKVVKIDGVQKSKELVNNSRYIMTPTVIVEGTKSAGSTTSTSKATQQTTKKPEATTKKATTKDKKTTN